MATILRYSTSVASRTSRRQSVRVQAGDAFCRDVVAVRKEIQSQGKVFKVALMGSDGEARVLDVKDDEYILDAADKQDVELPATCRGGICGACVARVRKGTFDQSDIPDLSFTLDEQQIEQGMALLCMTRATSDMEIETQCDWGYSLGVAEWKGASGKFEAAPDPLMGTKWNEEAVAKK